MPSPASTYPYRLWNSTAADIAGVTSKHNDSAADLSERDVRTTVFEVGSFILRDQFLALSVYRLHAKLYASRLRSLVAPSMTLTEDKGFVCSKYSNQKERQADPHAQLDPTRFWPQHFDFERASRRLRLSNDVNIETPHSRIGKLELSRL